MAATVSPVSLATASALKGHQLGKDNNQRISSDAYCSWIPNALDNWDDIVNVISSSPLAIFLDYDGTLSPIVADPASAFLGDDMRKELEELSKMFEISIVTGRPMDRIRKFLDMDNLFYAASHGCDIDIDGGKFRLVIGEQQIPALQSAYDELLKELGGIKGCIIENNKLSVSVHYRKVDNSNAQQAIRAAVDKAVKSRSENIKLTSGDKVWEIRPTAEWDKGKAVDFILQKAFDNSAIPIYVGDDRTDEDAFKVVRDRQGISIVVSNVKKDTSAEFCVSNPVEVLQLLKLLREVGSARQSSYLTGKAGAIQHVPQF